jgi:mannan endo-1,4-beta-mannosidase
MIKKTAMKRQLPCLVLLALLLFFSMGCARKVRNPVSAESPGVKVVKNSKTTGTSFKTLDYLYRISGHQTIAGIHNKEPNATPARWTEEVKTATGKYPGLWSGDFLFQAENIDNRQLMVNEALKQWKKGAVINIMWHACNPALIQPCGWEGGVLSKLTDDQWHELLTDGTPVNRRWKEMMDEVAGYLQFLKDHGVEVLFRPLHEMNQGVFWWGGRPGPEGTAKLYRMTHDYMTLTKGLTNLIWIWDIQDFGSLTSDVTAYNPGNQYWDVAALDVYDDKSGYSMEKYTTMVGISGGKPIAVGECQTLPTAEQLKLQPKWTFFMGWSELEFSKNTVLKIQQIHHAPNIITLDKMPGW